MLLHFERFGGRGQGLRLARVLGPRPAPGVPVEPGEVLGCAHTSFAAMTPRRKAAAMAMSQYLFATIQPFSWFTLSSAAFSRFLGSIDMTVSSQGCLAICAMVSLLFTPPAELPK